ELRIASGDDQVAAEGQLETARQRPPLDRGDQRLLRWSLGQTTEPPPRQRGTLAPGERLQVHSGAEGPTGTGEDADDRVGALVELVHGGRQLLGHLAVHGIAGLRAVDGEDRDPVADLGQDTVTHADSLSAPPP